MGFTLALPTSVTYGYPTCSPTVTPLTFTCPNCFFGATAATLHSFPYTPVATITEHVFPFVKTYPNGTICTEFSTSTEFPVVTDPHLLNGPTFSDENQMTWATLNYSMAYPSTYVQYLGFEKDVFNADPTTVDDQSICSGEKTPTALFDNPTPAASYIYPLTVPPSTTTSDNTLYFSVPVPTNVLDYIESLASASNIAPYTNIKQCAVLRTSYVNFNGPIDAPTLTLCDTTYSTLTLTSSSTSSSASYGGEPAYPTYAPNPSTSISTIVHCSFGQATTVAIKAGVTPGIAGAEWQRPYTTFQKDYFIDQYPYSELKHNVAQF
ncbi:hypothetical protein HII31_01271 [Pseudocercospora fuligena]|uniref:Uncharacterized protein n=1 Tax=Pseudocercospora fuligena TaxID=685502 RepID=A0A8H6RS70_9PEZI|nr:hypothetical protein HII31_01271 [Pseudocercospora fuligena]